MKKLLGILVLGLLWCSVGFTFNLLSLPKDVVSGSKFFKINNTYGTFKKYGMQVVDKKDGHPVRAGEKSIRFEVRSGDCGRSRTWNDCETHRERLELNDEKKISSGTRWYAWSIYLPKDFINVYPVRVCLVQFHDAGQAFTDEVNPPWMFLNIRGGYWVNNMVRVTAGFETQLLTREQMLGKWNDILINVKWTNKENGFFKIWVNDKLAFDYKGPTKRKSKINLQFGIYRYGIFIPDVPTQVVYYDEVRVGKKKEDVVGNLPPLQ